MRDDDNAVDPAVIGPAFRLRVFPRRPDQCWAFAGDRDSYGYSLFRFGGRQYKAHRVAFWLANGFWPNITRHTCDTPWCVNPGHLLDGTLADNVADRVARGRCARGDTHHSRMHPELRPRGDKNGGRTKPDRVPRGARHGSHTKPERVARGERQGAARLTEAEVRLMREMYAEGVFGTQISAALNRPRTTVYRVLRRETWAHVE